MPWSTPKVEVEVSEPVPGRDRGLPGWAPPSGHGPAGWPGPFDGGSGPPGYPGPHGPPGPGAPFAYPGQWGPYGPPAKAPRRFGWGALIGTGLGGLVLGGVGALILAAIVIGFAGGFDSPGFVAGTHGPVAAESSVATVGVCLTEDPGSAVIATDTEVVSCNRSHGSEVFGIIEAPAAEDRPSSSDLDLFVDGACGIAFRGYVGSAYDDSDLDYEAVVPDRAAWAAGDRRVWCLLDSSLYRDGEGSARDSGA